MNYKRMTNEEVANLIDLDSTDFETQAKIVAEVDKIEDRVQATFCKWLDIHHHDLVYFAIPNGGKRDKITAHILKQTGTKAGVPDMFFAFESKNYNGFFIEVKVKDPKKGKLSEKQKEWISKLKSKGYHVYVCNGVIECCTVLDEHIKSAWED